MKLSRLKLLPIAAAALAFASAGTAQAAAYAYSYDNIYGLTINTVSGTTTFVNSTVISRATATLNGASTITGGSGVLDAPQATMGAVTKGQNDFTPQGLGPAAYSRGDAQIVSTQVPPFPAGSTSTQAVNAAESYLPGSGTADASGRNGSTTGFSVNFVVGSPSATLAFNFSADPYMQVFLDALSGPGSSATANLVVTYTITNAAGAIVFNWTPDGVVGSGITGGTESADGANLNTNLATTDLIGAVNPYNPVGCGVPTGTGISTACGAAFAALTNPLAAGAYTLVLNAVESTDLVITQVPEPGTLALVGLGLAGLCVGSRRKSFRKN